MRRRDVDAEFDRTISGLEAVARKLAMLDERRLKLCEEIEEDMEWLRDHHHAASSFTSVKETTDRIIGRVQVLRASFQTTTSPTTSLRKEPES